MIDQKDTPLPPDAVLGSDEIEKPHISRRDFLRLGGLLGAELILRSILRSPELQTIEWLEEKFGVDIVEPEEEATLPDSVKDRINTGFLEIASWSESELAVLEKILEKLPPGMYAPESRYGGKRLQFLLGFNPRARRLPGDSRWWIYGASCQCTVDDGVVVLVKAAKDSVPSEVEFSTNLAMVTHELTHKIVGARREGAPTVFDSLGASWEELVGPFWNDRYWPDQEKAMKMVKPTDLHYGAEFAIEFAPVGAEVYIQGGKDFFLEVYSPFLGADRSRKFYDWLRVNVFDGRTYETYEVLPGIESVNKIRFRKDRIITVNDKPLFPIGIFYLPGPESSDSWDRLKNAGFNTIAGGGMNDEAIQRAEERGIYIAAYLPYAFPGFENKNELDPSLLKRYAKSPSLLAWYGVDEPSIGLKKDAFAWFHRQLRRLDPNHPMWTSFFDFPGWHTGLGDKIPFAVFKENYPGNPVDLEDLPDKGTYADFQNWWNSITGTKITGFGIGWTEYAGNDFRYGPLMAGYRENLQTGKLGNETKAVWVILPAQSEVDLNYKAIRFQAYEVIANGATGVFWWDWPYGCTKEGCPTYPEKGFGYASHWEKLKRIARELNQLQEGLTGQTSYIGRNGTENVSFRITHSKGKHYVFCVSNLKPGTGGKVETVSGLPTNTRFEVYGENRHLETDENGELQDGFDPLSAHVYVESISRPPE